MRGMGCPECGKIALSESRKISQEEFIRRARNAHRDTYDYNDVVYSGYDFDVIIKCKKHGTFPQTPGNHLAGYLW